MAQAHVRTKQWHNRTTSVVTQQNYVSGDTAVLRGVTAVLRGGTSILRGGTEGLRHNAAIDSLSYAEKHWSNRRGKTNHQQNWWGQRTLAYSTPLHWLVWLTVSVSHWPLSPEFWLVGGWFSWLWWRVRLTGHSNPRTNSQYTSLSPVHVTVSRGSRDTD